MKYILLIFLFPCFFLTSCEKDDSPYILPDPGNVELAQVSMGETYNTQIYFDFETKKQYSNNLYDWDLAFETASDAFLVRMNGGKQVQLYNTLNTNFNMPFSIAGIEWKWDSPDGNTDSVATNGWYNLAAASTNFYVYLIDRGPETISNRYKKMQLLEVDQDKYRFVFANIDGSEEKYFQIEKDSIFNFVYFTFNDGGKKVTIEPGKYKYDILFTRYRYIYYNLFPVLPYTVNGVLINPFNTAVAADSITSFDSIDYEFAKSMTYTDTYDVIGFDWKTYNFTNSIYEVNAKKCYVLKNNQGVYFKFRFIDFYDEQGIKGSPEFEYQRL